MLANKRAFEAMPADLREIVEADSTLPPSTSVPTSPRSTTRCARPGKARAWSSSTPTRPPSGSAEEGGLLRGVEEASSARRPGACWRRPSATCPDASGGRHGSRRIAELASRRAPVLSPPSMHRWHTRHAGGTARGDAGRRRDRRPAGRRGRPLRASIGRWCGRTSWPRSCSCGSPCWARWWRCAAREHMRLTAVVGERSDRAAGPIPKSLATCAGARVPAADRCHPRCDYADDEWFIETPALEISNILRAGGVAGRRLPDAAVRAVAAAALGAGRLRAGGGRCRWSR